MFYCSNKNSTVNLVELPTATVPGAASATTIRASTTSSSSATATQESSSRARERFCSSLRLGITYA